MARVPLLCVLVGPGSFSATLGPVMRLWHKNGPGSSGVSQVRARASFPPSIIIDSQGFVGRGAAICLSSGPEDLGLLLSGQAGIAIRSERSRSIALISAVSFS